MFSEGNVPALQTALVYAMNNIEQINANHCRDSATPGVGRGYQVGHSCVQLRFAFESKMLMSKLFKIE